MRQQEEGAWGGVNAALAWPSPSTCPLPGDTGDGTDDSRCQKPADLAHGCWRVNDLGDQEANLVTMVERNVLGGDLVPCCMDPVTGYLRDGYCRTGPDDPNSHTICVVITEVFLEHQAGVGNDLTTPRKDLRFPGLKPGDRWCVIASKWLEAYEAGAAAPVVLTGTNVRALEIVPLEALRACAVEEPSPGPPEQASP